MSSPRPLTDRQRQVLHFIVAEIDRCGSPPSRREICAAFGIASVNGVRDHLSALTAKGCVEVDAVVDRGIRVTQRGRAESPAREAVVLVDADGLPAISTPAVAAYRLLPLSPRLEGSTT